METMALMGDIGLPDRALRAQIASAVQIIVQVSRMSDGTRRITHITEITGVTGEIVSMQGHLPLSRRKAWDPPAKWGEGAASPPPASCRSLRKARFPPAYRSPRHTFPLPRGRIMLLLVAFLVMVLLIFGMLAVTTKPTSDQAGVTARIAEIKAASSAPGQ